MTAYQLFCKTMPFNLAKLALGAVIFLVSIISLVIFLLLGSLFNDAGYFICICLWLVTTYIAKFYFMHYFGYLVKAGHIAVITETIKTGQLPENQIAYGKETVKNRFATANVYFLIDKLVSNAVKQIQSGVQRIGNVLGFVPGMSILTNLSNLFIRIFLGYIDECCLGYTFYQMQQGTCKSATDGVVIYAENWRILLKNAANSMLKVFILLLVLTLIAFLPITLIFYLLGLNLFVGFLIAILLSAVFRFAFIDSFILCETMTSYLAIAPKTEITIDLYGKLCRLSSSFKKLFSHSQTEQPLYATSVSAETAVSKETSPVFCPFCGSKCKSGVLLCSFCGTKLR